MITAIIYLVTVAGAEVVTVYISVLWGTLFHLAVFVGLMVHSSVSRQPGHRRFLLSLVLVPLVPIISVVLPLGDIRQIYQYPIIYTPLLVACLVIMYVLGETPRDVGLTLKKFPVQLVVLLAGFPFGIAEYYILGPDSLVYALTFREAWLPVLVLLTCTGFVEELIFRGVLQRASTDLFGWLGIIYIGLLFAVLHMGYRSLIDMGFVFVVALFFGWIVKKTGSLIGVILAHGITNITLYLVMPLYPNLISQLF